LNGTTSRAFISLLITQFGFRNAGPRPAAGGVMNTD